MNHFIKTTLILILSVFCFGNTVYSQLINPDTINLSGIVLDSDSLFSLPNTHIISQKNTGFVTDANGHFAFKINAGDTLTFSYVGYKDYVYTVPDTLKYNNYMMGVILDKDTIMLSEIIILPWMNKQQFKKAFIESEPDMHTVNATRNLDLAGFTARSYTPGITQFDAVQYQLNQYTQNIEYKGMVSPGQSFNIVGFASFLVFLSREQLTKDEKEYRLRTELRQYIEQQQQAKEEK